MLNSVTLWLVHIPILIVVGAVWLFAAQAGAEEIALVVNGWSDAARAIARPVQRLDGEHLLTVHDMSGGDLTDPILKGRFLARIAAADIVVPIEDDAIRMVLDELRGIRTFFVGGVLIPGEALARPDVSGVLAYSPNDALRLALRMFPSAQKIAVVFTGGYETQIESARRALHDPARLVARRVNARRELGPAVRDILPAADIFWLIGDPLIAEGAGFLMIRGEALTHKVPLIGPDPGSVGRGVVFCVSTGPGELGEEAYRILVEMLTGRDVAKLHVAQAGQRIAVDRELAEKLGARNIPARSELTP